MKKPFLIALGLTAIAACGGKVVVEAGATAGTGGAGGTSSTITTADGTPNPTTDGVTTIAVSVGPSSSAVTTGTGMSCDPTYSCAEAFTPPDGDPSKLCDNTLAAKLYDVLVQCICADICTIECGNNGCIGEDASTPCKSCIVDPGKGCGNQFNDCANANSE